MKPYTVHIDYDLGDGERNDYLIYVRAPGVLEAVQAAKTFFEPADYIDDSDFEVLDVFEGHVHSLWHRPEQRPLRNGETV